MPVCQFFARHHKLTLVGKLACERGRDARAEAVPDDDDVLRRVPSIPADALRDPVPRRARVSDQASLRRHARRVRVASVVDRNHVAAVSYDRDTLAYQSRREDISM